MVSHGIADDFAKEGARIPDFKLFPKGFDSLQRGVLFEVFVVEWPSRSLSGNADQQSNFTRINVHVTNLRSARLYVT